MDSERQRKRRCTVQKSAPHLPPLAGSPVLEKPRGGLAADIMPRHVGASWYPGHADVQVRGSTARAHLYCLRPYWGVLVRRILVENFRGLLLAPFVPGSSGRWVSARSIRTCGTYRLCWNKIISFYPRLCYRRAMWCLGKS